MQEQRNNSTDTQPKPNDEIKPFIQQTLTRIAKEQNFTDFNISIKPTTSGGANFSSCLYNVTITEEKKVLHLFVKLAMMGTNMRSNAPNIYHIEFFAYTDIIPKFHEIQEEHNVPKEDRLTFAKFYGCHSTVFQEVVVLEDLVKSGYQSFDRFKGIEWEYSKAAVKALATWHSLSFAYSEYYPGEYNDLISKFKARWTSGNALVKKLHAEGVTAIAVARTNEEHKEKMERFVAPIKSYDIYNNWISRPIIGHGDFRPSNLLHKYREDGTVEIKIVDLQTMQGNSPVVDLLYFIFTGSDEEFRKNYYDKLIDYYYEQLEASMKRLHLNPDKVYSRADFDYELKEKLPFGLTIAVFALPIVTVEAKNAPKVDENMELTAFSVENTSDLYKERLNGVVNDFVKWGILK